MSACKQKCAGQNVFLKFLRPAVIGASVGAVAVLLIILIASVIFAAAKSFAADIAVGLAVAAAALGAFLGGFIAAFILRSRGLPIGAATGFILFAVVWLISALCSNELFTTAVLAEFLLMVAGGGAGGYLAVNTRRKR